MAAKLLEVQGLRVAYDKIEAVTGVDLAVGQGQIVTVIGPNGAGKTTLLSAIMGVLPSSGRIVFDGKPREHAEIEEMVAAGMNLVPEKRELFSEMTVEDNLMLGAFHRYRRGQRDHDGTLAEVMTCSRACANGVASYPARCPAANGRCWRWAAR